MNHFTITNATSLLPVDWDRFSLFSRCPRWHDRTTKGITEGGYVGKDLTAQVRFWALNLVLKTWLEHPIAELPGKVRLTAEEVSYRAVSQGWPDRSWGYCSQDLGEISDEVLERFVSRTPLLLEHLRERCLGDLPKKLYTNLPLDSHASRRRAILTMGPHLVLISPKSRVVLYTLEGDKNPVSVNDDAARWNSQILIDYVIRQSDLSHLFPALTHYRFSWETGEFREVKILEDLDRSSFGWVIPTPEHRAWLERRDEILSRMLEEEIQPTPSREGCHRCPHRPACPDHYKPKSRMEKPEPESSRVCRQIL